MKPFALGPQEQIAADQFRSFYAQLSAIRDAILTALAAPAGAEGEAGTLHQPTIETVRGLLARTIAEIGYRPDAPGALGNVDPGYVMAAVADEVLLIQCPGWADHEAWIDEPLEFTLYGTRLAGDRVFEAADELLGRRREDPRTAMAVLLALLTGFRGRYQGRDDGGKVAQREAALYELACNRSYNPEDPGPYNTPDVSPAALTGDSLRPLPALWPWLVALMALLLAYLPVSHAVWYAQTRKVPDKAREIMQGKSASEARPSPVPGAPGSPRP